MIRSPHLASSRPLACIDMGSNSFRLEVGQILAGRYKRSLYLKDSVRLGAGLDEHGMLTGEAVERGLSSLRRFASSLTDWPAARIRAVATQTLREARNRNDFLLLAEQALGFPIEVISGREEARLIFAGVAHLQPSETPRLVIDIGGRSTELILGQGRTPLEAESFQVGSVSLSMRYFPEGKFTAEAFRAAQIAAGATFEEALTQFAPQRWQEALGSSGTAGAVSDVLQACGQTDGRITPEALRWLILRCIAAGSAEQLELPGLKPERKAVLAGGICILYTLLMNFSIAELLPAKGALRQGVIVDLHDRLHAATHPSSQDPRDEAVQALQQRFNVDTAQAQRVSSLAQRLFRQAQPEADASELAELRWAAELHEIGLMVSHHDHHRHSAYLMAHVDAVGFSQSQQRRLAELVLGQRGGLRKMEASLRRPLTAWQLLCLRLAIIKCHARQAVDDRAWQLHPDHHHQASLRFSTSWAQAHPATLYLLREEAESWARNGPLSLHLPE
jgi:exopolyphosphatase/guanosine-5'-triphosphate,3'-diphosphate pyrophosphatase